MRFSLSSAGLQEWNGDVLAVGLPQGDVDATATALEQRFAGITEALKQQEFKGKPGDQLVITPLGGGPQRLVVLGLGESDAIDTDRLRSAATRARRALEQQLIQRWWPPFNKETRQRWATPFTAEL